ncbi:MAG: FecR domain-containing protein [Alphaproteobacteria bacterium]|nr:FecR domain-containing protein [Alphaproteobacteria bacterium]MBL6953277.1 FecR domain-containing protein [Alphaproteobacteria bacterium]
MAVLIFPAGAQAADSIGAVNAVVEYAYGRPPGADRKPIYLDDAVFAQEVVETISQGALHILFRDDTDLRLGSATTVTLDKFVYNAETNAGELVASMSRGVFRFITGKIQKQGVSLRTPTSHIGIRGTDFTVVVAEDGATQVAVAEGAVVVTPVNGGAAATVTAGQGATVGAAGNSVQVSQAAAAPEDPGLGDPDDSDSSGDVGGGGGGH